jgi:uncharacterized OB-fold protein
MAKPVPVPDDVSSFHWEAAREGRLAVQRCASCSKWLYPPTIACPRCQSLELVPTDVSGRGTIYSYTVARQAFDPAYMDDIPYTVALVELEEDADIRILTNIVDIAPADVEVGLPVEVTFVQRGDAALPVFRPSTSHANTNEVAR